MRFLLFDCTVPGVPQTRLNSACGTWDKIEICLRYLRYRNRTLPWTLPPVPQVSLQLYGNQALSFHMVVTITSTCLHVYSTGYSLSVSVLTAKNSSEKSLLSKLWVKL